MKRLKTSRIAAVIGAIALIGSGLTATAAHAVDGTHTVCAADCEFETIQAAVDAADAGDTINVSAGTYNEAVSITKSLTLNGPAVGASPNTSDPLTAADRGAEAIIAPAAGSTNHAFTLSAEATDVTVSGLYVDLGEGASNQRFVQAQTSSSDRNLSISSSVFTGGTSANSGSFVVSGALGNPAIRFSDNRVTDSGASNGLNIRNTSAAPTELTITDNVWLDNRGLAMNLSGTSQKQGTISENWIGNSTPGQSGVDQFGLRQGGMVLAGDYDDLQITGNTLKHTEDAGFSLWTGMSGSLAITGNILDGYSNMPNYAAVYVRPSNTSEGTSNVENVTVTENLFVNPTAGSRAVLGQDDTGTLDARLNWWGDANPDFDSLVIGNVETDPWFVNADLSQSSDYPEVPSDSEGLDTLIEENNLDVSATTKRFVPTDSGTDLQNLDPSQRLSGELPWENPLDDFVDVFAFSEPVPLGTFPVVDGAVQLDADISALADGTHRLLFIGQVSGDVQVMEITIQSASEGEGGGNDDSSRPGESGAPTPPKRVETGLRS